MSWLASLRWSAHEVGASMRHFVRLASREDVDAVRGELAEVRRAIADLEHTLARLERATSTRGADATSERPSRGPGTP